MRIKTITNIKVDGKFHMSGHEIDVKKEIAEELIKDGKALAVETKTKGGAEDEPADRKG